MGLWQHSSVQSGGPARVCTAAALPHARPGVHPGVVVRALRHLLGVRAPPVLARPRPRAEHLAQGTPLLARDAVNAEEELPAVERVGVLGEGAGRPLRRTLELPALVVYDDLFGDTLWHLAHPQAAVRHLVIRQAWGAVVTVRFAVLAVPEDAAVLRIRECSEQTRAVRGGDGRLELRPLPALLQFIVFVCDDESKAVAAGSELLHAVLAGPVLVAADQVRVEPKKLVRADEVVQLARHGGGQQQQGD